MQNTIHKFVKKNVNGRKARVGVIVGRKDKNGTVHFGWSLTNTKAGDQFDKERGLIIAEERTYRTEVPVPPHTIKKHIPDFKARCSKYFKDAKYIQPVPCV